MDITDEQRNSLRNLLATKLAPGVITGVTNAHLTKLIAEQCHTAAALSAMTAKDLRDEPICLPAGLAACLIQAFAGAQEHVGAGGIAGWGADEMLTRFWHALKTAKVIEVADHRILHLDAYFAGDEMLGSKILLRGCYTSLIERIQELRQRTPFNVGLSRFLITGTPGIGKSFFAYALMHWLATNNVTSTVVLETPNQRLLFVDNGTVRYVRVGNTTDFGPTLDDPATWWILDMVEAHRRKAVTIVLSSPERSRYKEFLKLQGSTKLYMPLWTDEEIECCRSQLFGNEVPRERAEELQSKWGNIPRYVLEKAGDPTAQALLDAAILACEYTEIVKCIGQPDAAHHTSHKLLHLSVVEDSHFQAVRMVVASRFVADQVSKVGALRHMEHLRSFVLLAIDAPATRAVAGAFFESYAHRMLQAGGKFEVRNLTSNVKADVQLEASEPIVFSKVEEVQKAPDAAYCMPKVHNFAAVDALQQPGTLLQMTVTQKSRMNAEGLAKARLQLRAANVRLYFVVPSSLFKEYKAVNGVDGAVEQWVLHVSMFDE